MRVGPHSDSRAECEKAGGIEAVSVSPIPQVASSSGSLEVSSFADVGFSDVRFDNVQETQVEKQNQRRNHFHG